MTLDGTTFGMVESYRGDFREEDRLVLNGTAYHTTLEEGTVILTSGLGGIFPRGIPIGEVQGLANSDAGWQKSYWLEAFVDPAAVLHVLVRVDPAVADLSYVWPSDSVFGAERLLEEERREVEWMTALADSARMLRELVAEPDTALRGGVRR